MWKNILGDDLAARRKTAHGTTYVVNLSEVSSRGSSHSLKELKREA